MSGFSGPAPTIIRSHLAGLALSAAGSTATFGVAEGMAVDSTNAAFMSLASAYIKTTSAWAVGTGNGAMDTGTVANSTWYHVHLIKRVDTGVVDPLFSLSATAPTLPANYTLFRRIGSMKTDGSAQWVKFIQDGDRFTWAAPVLDVNANNPGTSAVTRTLSTPLGVRVQANLTVIGEGNAFAGPGGVYISDLSATDAAASSTNSSVFSYLSPNTTIDAILGAQVSVMTDTSSQVRSRIQISSANVTLYMSTIGWIDRRGRDS
jgi:hypothetical protein